jgi:predicted TIM-barrel fold metal-dependent hydrolase
MTGEPAFWGLPKLADPHWDPLWRAVESAELSVNFHIASGDMSVYDSVYDGAGKHANYVGFGVQFGMANVRVIANLITGGVCHRFPNLKFVSVESGVGWIPYALRHLDWQWKNCGVPLEHPEYDLLPSEYFVRQMYGCFWFEDDTVKSAIDQFGADWILYESDFPHPTSMAPGPASTAVSPREYIVNTFGELATSDLQKILHSNAARLYHLDQ